MIRPALLLLALALTAPPAWALEPGEALPDRALEARARHISADLRCLVCQNQSIDDSDAPLARDLRAVVRDRLKAGDSDRAVVDYVVSRYGEFVLLRPVIAPHTLLLWFGPFAIFALAGGAILLSRRRAAPAAAPAPLAPEEEARLRAVLEEPRT